MLTAAEYQAIRKNINEIIQSMHENKGISSSLRHLIGISIPESIKALLNHSDAEAKRIAQCAIAIIHLYEELPDIALEMWQSEFLEKNLLVVYFQFAIWNKSQVAAFANSFQYLKINKLKLAHSRFGSWNLECFSVLTDAIKKSQVTEIALAGDTFEKCEWPHFKVFANAFTTNVTKLHWSAQFVPLEKVCLFGNMIKATSLTSLKLGVHTWSVKQMEILVPLLMGTKLSELTTDWDSWKFSFDQNLQVTTLCLTHCHLDKLLPQELTQLSHFIKGSQIDKLILIDNEITGIPLPHFIELFDAIGARVKELDLTREHMHNCNLEYFTGITDALKKGKIKTLHLWVDRIEGFGNRDQRWTLLKKTVIEIADIKVIDFFNKYNLLEDKDLVPYFLQYFSSHQKKFARISNENLEQMLVRAEKIMKEGVGVIDKWETRSRHPKMSILESLFWDDPDVRSVNFNKNNFSKECEQLKEILSQFITKLICLYLDVKPATSSQTFFQPEANIEQFKKLIESLDEVPEKVQALICKFNEMSVERINIKPQQVKAVQLI